LNAVDSAVDGLSQCSSEHGLTDTRHVFDEQVTLGEKHSERHLHDVALAIDHRLDTAHDLARQTVEIVDVHCVVGAAIHGSHLLSKIFVMTLPEPR